MSNIKEKRAQLDINLSEHVKYYLQTVHNPALKQLEDECEAAGHVNLQTLSQPEGPDYFLCDNCGKKIHL